MIKALFDLLQNTTVKPDAIAVAFDVSREELAKELDPSFISKDEEKHNSLWDAKVIRTIHQQLWDIK